VIAFSALLVGGTKGIGLAVARRLVRPGAQLFLNYHSDDVAAGAARQELTDLGATVHLVKGDISRPDAAMAVVAAVAQATPRLDAVVHSAATPTVGMLHDQDVGAIAHAVEVGGLSFLYIANAAVPLMGAGGSVVFVSGGAVDTVLPGLGALAVAKAAGEAAARYLAIELAAKGINCNIVRSGTIATDLFQAVRKAPIPPTLNGRVLETDDVAEAICFLLSPAGSMIRGQTLVVDGGVGKTIRMIQK
jgi:enoyl-[acyl-carrier protein] reductase III